MFKIQSFGGSCLRRKCSARAAGVGNLRKEHFEAQDQRQLQLHSNPPVAPSASRTSLPPRDLTHTAAMSLSCQRVLRRCATVQSPVVRASLSSTQNTFLSRRWQSTEAAAPTNPKIAAIVDQIGQLTLLETADLVSSLKVSTSHAPLDSIY